MVSVSLDTAEMQKMKSSIDYIENDMTELGQVMDDVVDNGAAVLAAKNQHANNMIPQIRAEPQQLDSYRVKPDRNSALEALHIDSRRTLDQEVTANLFSPTTNEIVKGAK